MVDAATIATAFDTTTFDVSDVATVVEADAGAAAPTMADDGAGALGTAGEVPRDGGIPVAADGATPAASAGYTARSLWQSYSVGIRSVTPVGWAVVQPGGLAPMNALTW